jgi:hypothetical protein
MTDASPISSHALSISQDDFAEILQRRAKQMLLKERRL